jgi:hypothetical protein
LQPELLPNALSPIDLRKSQRVVNSCSGVLLHSRQYVAVEVERDPNFRMPKSFGRYFRMNTTGQQVRGVGMSKVMK